MKKKILSLMLATMSALTIMGGLTACDGNGKTDTGSGALVVWAPAASHDIYKELVKDWQAETNHQNWTVTFEARNEGECETDFGSDPAAGADVFFFESGNYASMKEKLYLQELDAATTAKIKERDGANADSIIDANSGLAWAFPVTADNGYFLWYDKTFFNETEVQSLDTMLKKINDANEGKADKDQKHFVFTYDDGWYETSWFIGGLKCELDWVTGTKNYYTNIHTTPEGYGAGLASIKYCSNPAIITGDDGVKTTGFGNGSVVAAVGGSWIQKTLQEKFAESSGDRTYASVMAATKLPTFTTTVNGKEGTYQMGSFAGSKYVGVNRYKNNKASILASISLADYLSSEKGQLARFGGIPEKDIKGTGAVPTNINVANSDAVKNDMCAKALAEQNAAGGYAQLSQDGLWEAMKAFGIGCHDKSINETNLQTELDKLATAMSKGGKLVTEK